MKKVVIIDDDLAISQMYRMKLEKDGFGVELANNGVTGLALVAESRPDMVLLDLIMPEMNGAEVLRRLKMDADLQDIPVIILTNTGAEESIQELLEMGAKAYIIKANETPTQVVEKIHQVLG